MFSIFRRSFSAKILISVLGLGIILWVLVSELEFSTHLMLSYMGSAALLVVGAILASALTVGLVTLLRNLAKHIFGRSN